MRYLPTLTLLSLLQFMVFATVNCDQTPVIYTKDGPVQGAVLSTVWHGVKYSSFIGIPYAEPPVGDLRFMPPRPKQPWKDVLNATVQSSVCVQWDNSLKSPVGSEDCLYLNVFTPQLEFGSVMKLKHVMVYIYGGAFEGGESNVTTYGPDFFMEEDVVIVTFNYRLGPLGFLSLDHSHALGNAGLKDQNLVLQWVQANIKYFGGDPNSVTIFGESAGSASVDYHMISKKSRGLFHRSILMSGTSLCPWAYYSRKEARDNAYKLGLLLGYAASSDKDLVKFLLQAPAKDIAAKAKKVDLDYLPFRPTVENTKFDENNSVFLDKCPVNVYNSGEFQKNPVMLGYTRDEMILVLGMPLETLLHKTVDFLNNSIGKVPLLQQLTPQITNLTYRLSNGTTNEAVKITTDIFFRGPIDLTQRLLAKYSPYPTFYYRLSYISPYALHQLHSNINITGVAHADDVGYIFYQPDNRIPKDPSDSFNQFRKMMVGLWADFAKYSNPTPKDSNPINNVTWPPSGKKGMQLDINTPPRVERRLIDSAAFNFEKLWHGIMPFIGSCKELIQFVNIN